VLFEATFDVAGLLGAAGAAAVPAAEGEATVPPPGLVPASRASPVVVRVVLARGWFINLIWSNGTAMSRLPSPGTRQPRSPPPELCRCCRGPDR
jgi:hypothetical protein